MRHNGQHPPATAAGRQALKLQVPMLPQVAHPMSAHTSTTVPVRACMAGLSAVRRSAVIRRAAAQAENALAAKASSGAIKGAVKEKAMAPTKKTVSSRFLAQTFLARPSGRKGQETGGVKGSCELWGEKSRQQAYPRHWLATGASRSPPEVLQAAALTCRGLLLSAPRQPLRVGHTVLHP